MSKKLILQLQQFEFFDHTIVSNKNLYDISQSIKIESIAIASRNDDDDYDDDEDDDDNNDDSINYHVLYFSSLQWKKKIFDGIALSIRFYLGDCCCYKRNILLLLMHINLYYMCVY